MGTRNLTMVIDKEGKTKVAQYGQWDGYPDGQGKTILKFLTKKEDRERLLSKLSKIRFIDAEGVDNDFITAYNKNAPSWSNEPDNRTQDQMDWFKIYISRDLGGKILENISNSGKQEILLQDESAFGNDTLSCEWCYVVSFKDNQLAVRNDLQSDVIKVYNLDNLPSEKDFINDFVNEDE